MIYRSLFEVEFALSLLLDEDKVATLRTLNDLRESERTHATLLLFSIFVTIDGNTFWPVTRVPSKLLTKRFISHWYTRISEFQFHFYRILTCNRTLQLRYNHLPFFLELWYQSWNNQRKKRPVKFPNVHCAPFSYATGLKNRQTNQQRDESLFPHVTLHNYEALLSLFLKRIARVPAARLANATRVSHRTAPSFG